MATAQNDLVRRLPRADRARLIGLAETIPLVLSEVLYETGRPTRHVYFPTSGFISLVTMVVGSPGVEVGMAGREGMLGAPLALGVGISPVRALV